MRESGGKGGGAGRGGMGSGPHQKITYMGRSRSKPPPAPDKISWFRAWGGGQFISLECIRTDCLMEDQARGGGDGNSIPARGLGLAENDGFHMA